MAERNPVKKTLIPPFTTPFFQMAQNFSIAWEDFFRSISEALIPLGTEQYFPIVNNQASAANVDGLLFDGTKISYVSVDFFIQRFHSGSSSIQGGTFTLSYNAKTAAWSISNGGPHAGVTFSITSAGQVQYTSTNIANTLQVSKVTWRARTLSARVNKPAAGWT